MYTEIEYEQRGHVGIITIDRPEARNALTFTTYAELADAVDTTTARCLVITGRDPAFCSGDDVKQVMVAASADLQRADREPRLTPAAGSLLRTDVPIIAAVNGAAVGWGMELALMADIRIASERAKFGELFVKRGLCCDVAGLARLAELVGREHAAELLYTGRVISAAEARDLRLVSRVVGHDDLLPAALELAEAIAANPAARRAGPQARSARGARSELGRPRTVGQLVARRVVPHRRPPRGRRRLPRKARPELHRPLTYYLQSMKDLRGTTAIVTGASRGIGVYIAKALAEEGVNLSLAARSEPELEAVRAEIEALGVQAIAVVCDVAIADDRANLLARTEAELGPVDVLVNNAGIERIRRFEESTVTDFTDTLAINLEAPILLTLAVVPGMLERRRGHVVNIASGAGKVGVAYGTSYCASKHGLVGFTHALRAEYDRSPVGFSVVCPGFVTDDGMYDRWAQHGIHAPRIAGTSKPEKVASVVVDCIRKDRSEVIVNTPPVRPLVVLANMFPSITPKLLRRFGYTGTFEKVIAAGIQ